MPVTTPPFTCIGLMGKASMPEAQHSLIALYHGLLEHGCQILLEHSSWEMLDHPAGAELCSIDEIGQRADLAVVVGGDGNMLGAARVLSQYEIGVIGVNRGNLGFLTDLNPDDALQPLLEVLKGDYKTEFRYLLSASVCHDGQPAARNNAINEMVLHSDKVAHMIEFEVYVDDEFMFSQRSDGLIVATPTGSTAYSLSAGGPILTPHMDAMTLVPMFPHTLSSRPIVVDGNSQVRIRIAHDNDPLHVSCDGHVTMAVRPGDDVVIEKHPRQLRLIHPRSYNYYHVLRNKLKWGSRLF
ncbi:NAD(+) kinase [Aliidiomarina sedimenti]|uniref:NAD kinase n=2 Tax=Aliidiomarina TaxID=1249554 RepID=A0A432WL48_9GAMM|nr:MULTISPECIES: NAD(+) kinase [Aliidiomarina]RUO32319.1 NAD(+) kinase [Aliidiomarina sedimenti]RUO34513.1 NAD(+) kinase [Aliidiomarina soli]